MLLLIQTEILLLMLYQVQYFLALQELHLKVQMQSQRLILFHLLWQYSLL